MKTRGLVMPGPRVLQWRDYDVQSTLAEYVEIAISACGICTWEQRVFRGAKQTYPFWGGHEVCGYVNEIVECALPEIKKGDRVALALMSRCGECRFCRMGLDNHCAYVRKAVDDGMPQGPRGFSTLMRVPAYQVFRLPSRLPPSLGTLAEPIACSLRSIEKANLERGSTAVVLGAGAMGLIHIGLLKIRGHRVIACDDDVFRREAAIEWGAELTLPLTEVGAEKDVLHITEGLGADSAFCIRGGSLAVEKAVRLVRRGGTVVLFQSILKPDDPSAHLPKISANDIHYREIALVGSVGQTLKNFKDAVEILSDNSETFGPLVSSVSNDPMEAFASALDPACNRAVLMLN
ncbi:MAG: alcohol dehydrogenase catalytic domain-containing protein [bacterium]